MESIKELGKAALVSKKNLPNLVQLLELAQSSDLKTCHAAFMTLTHVFSRLIARGDADRNPKKDGDDVGKEVAVWIKARLQEFVEVLCAALLNDDPGIQVGAFFVKADVKRLFDDTKESINMGKKRGAWAFDSTILLKVATAVSSDAVSHLLEEKIVDYLNGHDDLRFYFYRSLRQVLEERGYSMPPNAGAVFRILSNLQPVDSEEALSGTFWVQDDTDHAKTKPGVVSSQKRVFSEAWLSFLRIRGMPPPLLKSILVILHNHVIPNMAQPTLLIDFLTDAYDSGGAVSVLALNGLFTLINEYNLDYPDFYRKLYALLDHTLLRVRYSSRFLRLLDLFLSSSYIPAYLIAAFLKRLSRLAVYAPPSGVGAIVSLVYNILKRHPACIVLIHRVEGGVTGENDPYDFSEKDPAKCRAMESSLWELQSLAEHFLSPISHLCGAFSEPLTKMFDLEDYLDQDTFAYADLDRASYKVEEIATVGDLFVGSSHRLLASF
ncbi:Nucleolar complex protein 4 [Irineochytrium annulatum]|nr:Nucleolar complex protein 4 [Irineochytrium annulatum]